MAESENSRCTATGNTNADSTSCGFRQVVHIRVVKDKVEDSALQDTMPQWQLVTVWKNQSALSSGSNNSTIKRYMNVNPLNTELNPKCHFLALVGPHHILHVSRIRVNQATTPPPLNPLTEDGGIIC